MNANPNIEMVEYRDHLTAVASAVKQERERIEFVMRNEKVRIENDIWNERGWSDSASIAMNRLIDKLKGQTPDPEQKGEG
jgi:hypothetical protein